MTAFLRRIAYWMGMPKEPRSYIPLSYQRSTNCGTEEGDYLADPNVPVEDLGGKPVYFENNQPVYPGREKAP